jgi:small neutral amino acid transporter SnatA (MarC family)
MKALSKLDPKNYPWLTVLLLGAFFTFFGPWLLSFGWQLIPVAAALFASGILFFVMAICMKLDDLAEKIASDDTPERSDTKTAQE